jgi:predicted GIY-YIG superfamily endonuclease
VRLFWFKDMYSLSIYKKTMENFKDYLLKSDIDQTFVDKYHDIINVDTSFINYEHVKDWIGYSKKDTIIQRLKKKIYNFKLNTDYKIETYKPTNGRPGINLLMTIDTIRLLCLISGSENGIKFAKFYIQMEKVYRQYVSSTIQNQISNPLPQINKYDFDINKFHNKEVLYLIYIKDYLYKFGITTNIAKRLTTHRNLLGYDYVVDCWECINRTVSKKIEDDIKRYCKVNKINTVYNKQTEIIKTTSIDKYLKIFTGYVTKRVDEYNDQFKDKRVEQQIKLVDKMLELQKKQKEMISKGINITLPDLTKLTDFSEEQEQEQPRRSTKESMKAIKDFEDSIQRCKHCKTDKKISEFKINKKTNEPFKKCFECRIKCRVSDKKRRDKYIEENKDNEILYPQKQEYYNANHDKIRKKQTKHYEKNKSEIIYQKKGYRNKRIEEAENDPDNSYCKKCNTIKDNDTFGINAKTKSQYKQCTSCRNKQTKKKKKK